MRRAKGMAAAPGRARAASRAGSNCKKHLRPYSWKKQPNRCADCGVEVGEEFTGYSADKMSKREPLWCDRCVQRMEAIRWAR